MTNRFLIFPSFSFFSFFPAFFFFHSLVYYISLFHHYIYEVLVFCKFNIIYINSSSSKLLSGSRPVLCFKGTFFSCFSFWFPWSPNWLRVAYQMKPPVSHLTLPVSCHHHVIRSHNSDIRVRLFLIMTFATIEYMTELGQGSSWTTIGWWQTSSTRKG